MTLIPNDEAASFAQARESMVRELRDRYRIRDERILNAMNRVRRHRYIPPAQQPAADPYGDHPCPIGWGQTISQPYIVAYMTQRIEVQPRDKVLEIGAGSGYQSAVLAELGARVYSIEAVESLAQHARSALDREGYTDVHVRTGDGFAGWPQQAPFDAIIGTCAPADVPPALIDQLDPQYGRMILPVGVFRQHLVLVRKEDGRTIRERDLPVQFVPMVQPETERGAS